MNRIVGPTGASLAALMLAACGGGGGGGTGAAAPSQPAPAPAPAPPVVVAPTPVGPSVTSAEFNQGYGLGAIKAGAAFARGASGKGITVAVIDTGMDGTGPDLAGRAAVTSTDLDKTRNQLTGPDRHGTYVAGIIGANFNGAGTVGVAFDSQIMSIRAERTTGCTAGGDVCFSSSDLAQGIDYAVANGAKVINLSLGSDKGSNGPTFEAALKRAVDAGVVVTAAAGNEGNTTGAWPSNYASDPRFAGALVAVGATNSAGTIATFSNRAGPAAAGFLVAPGESIITDCNATTCRVVSGTSFSAPYVSGSIAVLLQAFPNMSGRSAIDLLFHSARDLGAPGNDPVYGWGAVDLERAFAPVGSLSVPVQGGGFVSESLAPGSTMGLAFGDATQGGLALRTVGWDHYDRPFATDLSVAYAAPRPALLTPLSADSRRHGDVDVALSGGAWLNIAAGLTENGDAAMTRAFPWVPVEGGRDVSVSYRSGRLGFSAWTGKASANPYASGNPDPYTALAQSDRAIRADYGVGRWRLSAEAGSGERRSPDLLRREDGARYLRASGQTESGPVRSTVTFGVLDEPMGPLGAYIPTRSGLNLPSQTSFAAYGGAWAISDRFTLSGEASLGRTQLRGRFLALQEPAWSSAWRVSLDGSCAAFGLPCGGLRFTAAQPLRIEHGRFQALLPDAPTGYFDPVTYSQRRFSASPSGRQTDFTLSATQGTALGGVVQLDAVASVEPGHRASADAAFGLLASWRAGF